MFGRIYYFGMSYNTAGFYFSFNRYDFFLDALVALVDSNYTLEVLMSSGHSLYRMTFLAPQNKEWHYIIYHARLMSLLKVVVKTL